MLSHRALVTKLKLKQAPSQVTKVRIGDLLFLVSFVIDIVVIDFFDFYLHFHAGVQCIPSVTLLPYQTPASPAL